MKKFLILNKKEGETPLEVLDALRKKNKSYKEIKMTYAGRLDPMASGLMLVLLGEETKNKDKYLGLDKEYEFEVLFGFATDTYDILGKVTHLRYSVDVSEGRVAKVAKSFVGKYKQAYPKYSSKNIKRVLLGEEVVTSYNEVQIKSLKLLGLRKINNKKLLENINKRVAKVRGEFRQKEILKLWNKKLTPKKPQNFYIGKFKIKCSSGTYVRSIANAMGQHLGTPALAYSIKRTQIGKYK